MKEKLVRELIFWNTFCAAMLMGWACLYLIAIWLGIIIFGSSFEKLGLLIVIAMAANLTWGIPLSMSRKILNKIGL
jgi:hypothetical protein